MARCVCSQEKNFFELLNFAEQTDSAASFISCETRAIQASAIHIEVHSEVLPLIPLV